MSPRPNTQNPTPPPSSFFPFFPIFLSHSPGRHTSRPFFFPPTSSSHSPLFFLFILFSLLLLLLLFFQKLNPSPATHCRQVTLFPSLILQFSQLSLTFSSHPFYFILFYFFFHFILIFHSPFPTISTATYSSFQNLKSSKILFFFLLILTVIVVENWACVFVCDPYALRFGYELGHLCLFVVLSLSFEIWVCVMDM